MGRITYAIYPGVEQDVIRLGRRHEMVAGRQNALGAGQMVVDIETSQVVYFDSRSGHHLPNLARFDVYLVNLMETLCCRTFKPWRNRLRLSNSPKAAHPEVEWYRIAGLRNILVHDYPGVDPERVWLMVERDLADFR